MSAALDRVRHFLDLWLQSWPDAPDMMHATHLVNGEVQRAILYAEDLKAVLDDRPDVSNLGPVAKGSMIVLRDTRPDHRPPFTQSVMDGIISCAGHTDFGVLFLSGTEGLELLDEQRMNSLGWVRKP